MTQNIQNIVRVLYWVLVWTFILTTPIGDGNFLEGAFVLLAGVFVFAAVPAALCISLYTFGKRLIFKETSTTSFEENLSGTWRWATGLMFTEASLARILNSSGFVEVAMVATALLATLVLTIVVHSKPQVTTYAFATIGICLLVTNSILPKGSLVQESGVFAYTSETRLVPPFTVHTKRPALEGVLKVDTQQDNWDIRMGYSIPDLTALTADEWRTLGAPILINDVTLYPDGAPKAEIENLLRQRLPNIEMKVSVTYTETITKTW